MDHLDQFIDLRRSDIEPEVFTAAIAIQHVSKLISSGGSSIGRPDLESALLPHRKRSALNTNGVAYDRQFLP